MNLISAQYHLNLIFALISSLIWINQLEAATVRDEEGGGGVWICNGSSNIILHIYEINYKEKEGFDFSVVLSLIGSISRCRKTMVLLPLPRREKERWRDTCKAWDLGATP